MKEDKTPSIESRRGFLRSAGQSGLLASAAAVGAVSVGSDSTPPAVKPEPEGKLSYHETGHIREYYRTLGIF